MMMRPFNKTVKRFGGERFGRSDVFSFDHAAELYLLRVLNEINKI